MIETIRILSSLQPVAQISCGSGNGSANLAAALKDAHYGNFVLVTRALDAALTLGDMHVRLPGLMWDGRHICEMRLTAPTLLCAVEQSGVATRMVF